MNGLGLKATISADGSEFKQEMEQVMSSTKNVTKELRQTTKDIQKMQTAYNAMSEEAKQSKFGEYLKQQINEATMAAAQLQDLKADIQQNISNLASDTVLWDGMAQGIEVARDSVTAFAASMGMTTKEGTLMGNTLNLITKAQTYANAAITIGNALQKQSKILSAITTLQKMAETKATIAQTAATNGATVAQRIFNAVAKANPYVLLAMAVVTVVTALVSFAAAEQKSAEEEAKAQAEAKKHAEALKKHKDALDKIGSTVGKTVGDFKALQVAYAACRTEAEKQKFIKDNKTAFEQLGIQVNNLNDAYTVLVKNAPQVIAALKAMAEAEAYKDLYKDAVKAQAMDDNRVKSRQTGDYYEKASNKKDHNTISQEEISYLQSKGFKEGQQGDFVDSMIGGGVVKSQKAIDEVNKYRNQKAQALRQEQRKQVDDDAKHYEQAMGDAMQNAYDLQQKMYASGVKAASGSSSSSSRGSSSSKTETPDDKFAKAVNEYVDKLRVLDQEMDAGRLTFSEYQKGISSAAKSQYDAIKGLKVSDTQIDNWNKAVQDSYDTYHKADDYIADLAKGAKEAADALDKIKASQENAQKQIKANNEPGQTQHASNNIQVSNNFDMTNDEIFRESSLQTLDKYKDKMDELEDKINATKSAMQALSDAGGQQSTEYNILSGQLENLQEDFDDTAESAQNLADAINAIDAVKNLKKMRKELGKGIYEGFRDSASACFDFADSIENLAENWDEMDGWERFKGVFEEVFSGIDTVLGLIEAIQTIVSIVNMFKTAQSAASIATGAATGADVTQASTQISLAPGVVAANNAMAASYKILTSAENTAAYASIPFVGMAMAPVAQGVYTGLWASTSALAAFAGGGILNGPTTIGDRTLFWGNSGEMILNGQEQSNLFNMLKYGVSTNYATASTPSNIEFVIKGRNLIGVQSNINKTNKYKIGK